MSLPSPDSEIPKVDLASMSIHRRNMYALSGIDQYRNMAAFWADLGYPDACSNLLGKACITPYGEIIPVHLDLGHGSVAKKWFEINYSDTEGITENDAHASFYKLNGLYLYRYSIIGNEPSQLLRYYALKHYAFWQNQQKSNRDLNITIENNDKNKSTFQLAEVLQEISELEAIFIQGGLIPDSLDS